MNDIETGVGARPDGGTSTAGGSGIGADAGDAVARERGWYRDPNEPRRHRYWDGRTWLPQATRLADDLPRPRPRSD